MLRSALHRVFPGPIRWYLRTWALSRPSTADIYTRVNPPLRSQRVTTRTDLLIDGFPRSANGFASYAMRDLMGPDAVISALSHSPRNFHRAARLGVPAVLLVRDPDAVVSSLLTYDPSQSEIWGFRLWAMFHEAVAPLTPSLIVADFETVIHDLPKLIRHVNARFGTSISQAAAAQLRSDEIFARIERRGKELIASGVYDAERLAARSSRPIESRVHRDVARNDAPWSTVRNRARDLYRSLLRA